MANRLADETSPYLLQHAENPVDWYPWGPEALQRARAEDRPIFLSIGYSACHWCHVMERESFEDPRIAQLLNEHFVPIKVDREERPDLDQVYMEAVQLMTGRGGWPMSVFLTPEQEPFFGGTYWPPGPRMGMPGFDQVLRSVASAWRDRRSEARQQAAHLTQHLQRAAALGTESGPIDEQLLQGAAVRLEQVFDRDFGGFGGAPKFPHAIDLQLLLRIWRRHPRPGLLEMAARTLDGMYQGGIYDHLGGGFARYSVDARWLVPHFEKMLYDNALLAAAYLDGYLVTGEARYARVVCETLDYVLRYMTDPQGGFHSAEDADSEGEEGKFYLWTPAELQQVLGPALATRAAYVYDVTDGGNFEGRNILHLPRTTAQCAAIKGWPREELEADLAAARQQLLAVRDQRVRPGKDDKVLVSWNGLMIDSLARAASSLQAPRFLDAALRAAEFLWQHLRRPDGRLLHAWRQGRARFDACLDDYAALVQALVSLYEATFEEHWIDRAVQLADQLCSRFADRTGGGFYYTADDHEPLLARPKDVADSSVPGASALAATALVRLGRLCARDDYLDAARRTLESAAQLLRSSPTAAGQMLIALDLHLGPLSELVVLGDPRQNDTASALAGLFGTYVPNRVVACRPRAQVPGGSTHLDRLFAGKSPLAPPPTVYVCRNFSCQPPVSGPAAAADLWRQLSTPGPAS